MDINQFIKKNWKNRVHPDERGGDVWLARKLKISVNAVRLRREKFGLVRDRMYGVVLHKRKKEMKPRERVVHDTLAQKLGHKHKDLSKVYKSALKRIDELEQDLEMATLLREAKKTFVIKPQHHLGESEAVAVALLSDWHVEQIVKPSSVNNLNKHNPEIAKERATLCFQRILRMVKKEQQDVKIDTILLWLGGDFFTNSLRAENLETNAMGPSVAAAYAQSLLASGIQFLSENFEGKIICVCSSGNHARVTDKVRPSTEYQNSWETFVYTGLRLQFPEVEWVIEEAYHTYVKVYDYTLRFCHGHLGLKYSGGIGGLTIPLLRAIPRWNDARHADWTFLGHYHQYLPSKSFVVNGSQLGVDAYGLQFGYEPPTQAFFLVDKKRGRTIHIPIMYT